ncbi:MAG: hypothetical protein U1C59_14750 [Methylotenera sp.]|uniref:hypothetical protein n=1 Tax=Methylotenera sp. TaxID=2051956 RepID=UPI002730570B|nr:hypothetical protein [Methylotenera sp.]MDP1522004.1 hypothetical protein [Methylotenera sp.]MDZ4212965.1 hypothetical protein [Methylotenera sp.]
MRSFQEKVTFFAKQTALIADTWTTAGRGGIIVARDIICVFLSMTNLMFESIKADLALI